MPAALERPPGRLGPLRELLPRLELRERDEHRELGRLEEPAVDRHSEPRRGTEERLSRVAGEWARQQLRKEGLAAPRADGLACRAWMDSRRATANERLTPRFLCEDRYGSDGLGVLHIGAIKGHLWWTRS